jgi:hypothetical protein
MKSNIQICRFFISIFFCWQKKFVNSNKMFWEESRSQISPALYVPDVTFDIQWWTSEDECKWVFTPYYLFSWNKHNINIYVMNDLITFEYIDRVLNNAHSVHAGSSSSCLAPPSFFLLLHVASLFAGAWLLISLLVWGAWPSLTHFPQADPISLRSQATPYPFVGHTFKLGL